MIQNTFDYEADQAASRYALLTSSWQGVFSLALNQADFGSSSHSQRMLQEATDLANKFLEQETNISEFNFYEIALEAHQTTLRDLSSIDAESLTERASEHLTAARTYLLEELFAQVRRDLSNMRQMLQRIVLEVSLASRSRGITERQALIEYRLGNKTEIEFAFMDRGNRKWSSRKFVRTLWRHTLLSVYNEVVMLALADHGIKNAVVDHIDPSAESHGTLIAFGSNSDLPTYSEVRDVIFHPNSNAVLKMEKLGVSSQSGR